MRKLVIYAFAVFLVGMQTANAQDLKIPQPSTGQTIIQDFGLGQITLTYSRPNVKGRKIFDYMEPYGIVWRMGANSATRIKFSESVQMEGHTVVPGEYALFAIPGAKEWTIILNQTANQWGAYSYDSSKDVFRTKVKSMQTDRKQETLGFQFVNAFVDHCDLQMSWENTALNIHFTTDVDAAVMANIDKLMQTDKKPYYFAAIYYYNHDKDMNKALEWMKERDKAQPNAYNVKYWLARIQLKAGDKQGAIATANEGLKLAQAENSAEYTRLNKEVLAEAAKK